MRRLLVIALLTAAARASDPPQYTEAVRLTRQQHWQEALAIIDTLLATTPDNPKLLNLDGLALLGAGRVKDARAAFEKALAKAPEFAPALKNLSILEWNNGMPDAAMRTEAALKANPTDAVLNAYGALAAMGRNDVQSAAQRLETAQGAVAALPGDLQYRLAIGFASRRLYPQAISLLKGLAAAGADSPRVRYNLALAQYLSGKYKDAIDTLEPLRAHRPSSDALNLLAQAWEKAGEPQKAIDTLREAAAVDPSDENNYLDLSNICMDHNGLHQALEVVQTGLHYKPASARLNFQLGVLRVLTGDFDAAQAAFERAASLEPASDLPGAGLQLATIQRSRLPEAIAGLRQQVREKPHSGILQCLLGMALVRDGVHSGSPEEQEAMEAFRQAIRLEPDLPYPYVELGKMYMHQSRPADAVPFLEKAAQMPATARAAAYQLAVAYRALNQPERSKQMFARFREMGEAERSNQFLSSAEKP